MKYKKKSYQIGWKKCISKREKELISELIGFFFERVDNDLTLWYDNNKYDKRICATTSGKIGENDGRK